MLGQVPSEVVEADVRALANRFRAREAFSRAAVEAPIALRLDGVGFGRALSGYRWPRDIRVHRVLLAGASALMGHLRGDYCYVTSDEVNLVHLGPLPYSGRVEKLVSVASSLVSSAASLALGRPLAFDCRVVVLEGPEEALDYVLYRMRVGFNNYVSSLYHSTLGARETPRLAEMVREVAARGMLDSPSWEWCGSCLYRRARYKLGRDPATDREVVARRGGLGLASGPVCLRILERLLKQRLLEKQY